MTEELDYFLQRAAQELDLAEKADSLVARQRHLDLAQRYKELVDGLPNAESAD